MAQMAGLGLGGVFEMTYQLGQSQLQLAILAAVNPSPQRIGGAGAGS